jgi:hypothetical protein
MSDIVERLRAHGSKTEMEAADEIERLQAQVAETVPGAAREAEISRLRAVLEEYACPGLKDCSQPKLDDGSCLAESTGGMCGDAAYRALERTG